MNSWRAGCSETGTSGSEGGPGKRTDRKIGTRAPARPNDSLDYAVVEPPEPVTAGMLRFLRAFGLSFGAFDFIVTPDQEWIMLECNPAGAYGWLEDALDLPITSALADLLANGAAAL